MFKIESYVTPILLSYVDKYVRDFKPADAQVSLWGGGVALHNLVLKADVLQQEVSLPFTLVSGRIHELLIQVPWTKIMSEPIIVTIDTIECVLNLNPPTSAESPPQESPSRKSQVVEAPPGYMQALVRRIVSNIALRVHHLIVKYVQDDIVMSLNVKHLAVDSAGINWEPTFADIDQNHPVIRRLVRLDDLTLCLDKADADGKIRFYQEPVLYRCQLDLRVMTRLVSANTRRASSLSIQLSTSKLAWSVTSDQLTLILRLIRERSQPHVNVQLSLTKNATIQSPSQPSSSRSSLIEPTRSNSWSEWAWSWLPSWTDKETGAEDTPMPPTPLPLYFSACLDDVSLVFKIMEVEGNNRKRSRSVLELGAKFAAIKCAACFPTIFRLRFGARQISVQSHGKCVCGFINYEASLDQPTVFLKRIQAEPEETEWAWPDDFLSGLLPSNHRVEMAEAVDEEYRASPDPVPESTPQADEQSHMSEETGHEPKELFEDSNDMWMKMSPAFFVEVKHERAPPDPLMNPYDNPPKDFQYSDWVEECHIKVKLEPVEVRACMGLVHRLRALLSIFKDLNPVPDVGKPAEQTKRTLTIEECDALTDNLPERRIYCEVRGLLVHLIPWNHSLAERPLRTPLILNINLPSTIVSVHGPLYPHRICTAACQLPTNAGPLWHGAHLHCSVTMTDAQAYISSISNEQQRQCVRTDLRVVMHILLNKEFFDKMDAVDISYTAKINELSICGSAARLQAAWQVPLSLINERLSIPLRHSSLTKDALNDEEAVAIDFTLEELTIKGYLTRNIMTHAISLESAKALALQEPTPGEVKQAWLFSAPDAPSTTPYLRMAVQWCKETVPDSFDYLGIWTEPTAISVDPLLISWLAYRCVYRTSDYTNLRETPGRSSTQFSFPKRTASSSAGRGLSRNGSGAELVHMRPRVSVASSSEPSELKEPKKTPQPQLVEKWWQGDNLVALHRRLRDMLINIEFGLIQVYVTMSSASAVDCITLRDAMERHANDEHRVLAVSLGRIAMHSNAANKTLWHNVQHDGPTYIKQKPEAESFPWKIRLADVSCYTLEPHLDRSSRTYIGPKLRSTLKNLPSLAYPRTVLDLVTTTITVSVVIKTQQIKSIHLYKPRKTSKEELRAQEPPKMKFFTAGTEFKPSTLQEFFRGPIRRSKKEKEEAMDAKSAKPPEPESREEVIIKEGPVVSLGMHLHADTPPVIIRLERDQVHVMAAAIHCFNHIVTLLGRGMVEAPKQPTLTSVGGSQRSLIRSVSEEFHTQSDESKSSGLIEIFDRSQESAPKKLTTFLWFQWVVSRATLVVASNSVKLAFDADDIITTVDIQAHYNQLKIKVASASIRHYERMRSDEWMAGVLGGRVLEARETISAKNEDHFLSVTITQAQLSNLPANWKQELNPKLLENKNGEDTTWEVYATLAPLEAIIQPVMLDNVVTLLKEMSPRAFCPLKKELETSVTPWQWPFCYLTAGGLRVLVTGEQDNGIGTDDTFVFEIGKVTVTPHPENPICRRSVNYGTESAWIGGSSNFEGHQYEIYVTNVSLRTARFQQIIHLESENLQKNTNENPALKWSQVITAPIMTPFVHSMDVCCVIAPAVYNNGVLAYGPAVELNLVSDCTIDMNIEQAVLWQKIAHDLQAGLDAERNNQEETYGDRQMNKYGLCPYAGLFKVVESDSYPDVFQAETNRSLAGDSGVDTLESLSTFKAKTSMFDEFRKSVSIVLSEPIADASEYLEVYFTMGTIDLTLYVRDDDSAEVEALRPPASKFCTLVPEPEIQDITQDSSTTTRTRDRLCTQYQVSNKTERKTDEPETTASRSLTENVRLADAEMSNVHLPHFTDAMVKSEENVPLLHVTLQQPNFYYWRKKGKKTIQLSVFNAWIALGIGDVPGHWHAVLLSTTKGAPDPVTDIPPALATMKIIAPVQFSAYASNTLRGSIRLEVERPLQLEVSEERLRRLIAIEALWKANFNSDEVIESEVGSNDTPMLYNLRRRFQEDCIDTVDINTGQLGLCGSEGSVGWDSLSIQFGISSRPDRMATCVFITSLVAATGPPNDRRHVLLQPMMLGVNMEATWEAWRRAEGGPGAREPSVCTNVEMDRFTVDFRPSDLEAVYNLLKAVQNIIKQDETETVFVSNCEDAPRGCQDSSYPASLYEVGRRMSAMSTDSDTTSHYYKDDLRSGAFKIVNGGQLPMAYQVMLHGNAVSWRYPHPRAITRIVVFPLPGVDQEIECVLELFTPVLGLWEPHTYFKIPIGEPSETLLYVPAPDAVYATMWRFRSCASIEPDPQPYEFNMKKFKAKNYPFFSETLIDDSEVHIDERVTAEQLSGVLRVDSYFAPRVLPRHKLIVRIAETELYVHNSLPAVSSHETSLEGYYVSRPLMRSHRVLSVNARSTKVHAQFGSPCGVLYVADTKLSSDILECATGTMEQLVREFRMQTCISAPTWQARDPRVRIATTGVHLSLHVPRMRTLHALATDWQTAFEEAQEPVVYLYDSTVIEPTYQVVETVDTESALDGRVSLWIHNRCACALRVGQEGTDELVPLGPGATLAYRWRCPASPKKLRLALADPTANWHWSPSIPFTAGTMRVKLDDPTGVDKENPRCSGVYVHVKVEDMGAKRHMYLSGRLTLANMLRFNLLFKVRSHCQPSSEWRTICSDEMQAETLGRSVVCGADAELVLKIKFMCRETGWSGDIPLKECPKENVPWLVKVPSEGESCYTAVWCRVVRARSDGRILATVWPLYVLYSHLPLDTDVLIMTEKNTNNVGLTDDVPPLVLSAPGRGTSSHLLAPGTTANKHNLSFQYRNLECPVTREAVPLHYGVTDISVFDKRTPVAHIDEVIQEIQQWLERSGLLAKSTWPYSIVTKHWNGPWQSALLQPRCDVTVRYQAVRAGGGCSLEIQLCPIVLLCNAAPIALTLRAHDAAPLCKLEPGTAIAPPSAILKKPFYMSVEMGRETFVSEQLEASGEELGRYATPPHGRIVLDHAARFSILCNQKVALLSMFYEIKQDINILGISATFVLINRLNTNILVSTIAVPVDAEPNHHIRAKTFKLVQPTNKESVQGTPLCHFWLRGRWRSGSSAELNKFICLALPDTTHTGNAPVPIRLTVPPTRRAIALLDKHNNSIPIVVNQIKHEHRWLIVVAHDPCPQFLVQNRTRMPFYIAQPVDMSQDQPSTSKVEVIPECPGARWKFLIRPESAVHYSTPTHCARFPPQQTPVRNSTNSSVTMLIFSRISDGLRYDWSAPVAAADGEHLLQFYGGVTIKLRVSTNPHSTLLELKDTDQNDISASDIRRRLDDMNASDETVAIINQQTEPDQLHEPWLGRVDGTGQLFADPAEKCQLATEETELLATEEQLSAKESRLTFTLPQRSNDSENSAQTRSDPIKQEQIPSNEMPSITATLPRPSTGVIFSEDCKALDKNCSLHYKNVLSDMNMEVSEPSMAFNSGLAAGLEESVTPWRDKELLRCVMEGVSIALSASADVPPLIAVYFDRTSLLLLVNEKKTKTILSVGDVQIDNLQYESGQYDFAVVASTRAEPLKPGRWPSLWNMFAEKESFSTKHKNARLLLKLTHDKWNLLSTVYRELTEVEIRVGSLALYVEDAYVTSFVELTRLAWPSSVNGDSVAVLNEERSLQIPLRLRLLHVHPLDLTLTLHTAVRMYIALDQSPLRLSAFKLHDMMTSSERLTHALTVHYLSAAILGAGWVVGGLELLGAPGALAARLGGATGGFKGVASATAAALLRSLSAWAGSLARNLDLLAGDEEHARRAAAARRRPPPSLVAGLMAGITNFAINILGAVGGLAHHPLVGVAVGETDSSAAALRRGILGALTKPLSATADLVAYAGHGLLRQTGWDPVPEARRSWSSTDASRGPSWRRDCVRWTFRLADMHAVAGFQVLLDNANLMLLLTHKFLVVADPESERIVEMIDFKFCSLGPYQGQIIELIVRQRKSSKVPDSKNVDDEDEIQISVAAMARVARYTGAEGTSTQPEARVLSLLPTPGRAHSLHAVLAALIHHNAETHLSIL